MQGYTARKCQRQQSNLDLSEPRARDFNWCDRVWALSRVNHITSDTHNLLLNERVAKLYES